MFSIFIRSLVYFLLKIPQHCQKSFSARRQEVELDGIFYIRTGVDL